MFTDTVFLFAIFFVGAKASQLDPLIITLPSGQIRGHELKSTHENTFYAFQEIPFASPPVDDLRFKDPVDVQKWEGIKNTTANTKICHQQGTSATPNVVQTEDCLYLNVYTPVVPTENASTLLPVLFWIYGGSFKIGDGTYQLYGPGHFMDYGIIVVTINYRLGPLGFLTTEDGVIPANLGLKDQNFALKWTHENIKLFGGDPDKVTIAGQSAGAASVGFQLLSKKSKGLFSGAILQSGTSISSWARQPFPNYYAYKMGSALDRHFNEKNSTQDLLELLQKASASDIINAKVTVTVGKENGVGNHQDIIWAPVIEDNDQEDPFITGPMEENLENGDLNKVPIMIGFTSEEVVYFFRGVPYLAEFLVEFGTYFDEDLLRVVNNKYNMTDENKRKAGYDIRNIYTEDSFVADQASVVKHLSMKYWNMLIEFQLIRCNNGLSTGFPIKAEQAEYNVFIYNITTQHIQFFSDQAYSTPQSKHAEVQSKYTDVFLYQFSYKGVLGGDNPIIVGAENVGHTEELMYMWDFHTVDINAMPASDILAHKRLLTLWTNFVKYLNPTPTADPLLENIEWPKVSPNNVTYLNINLTLGVEKDPKEYQKWKPIIDEYAIPPLINY